MMQKNVPAEHQGEYGYGDVWTWTAICADTKLVPSWYVGRRDTEDAFYFISDLKNRLANRVQLSTDGHKPYLHAVEATFGADVNYAMIHKIYGAATGGGRAPLQPRRLHGDRQARDHRQPRRVKGVHELRGAPEPHHADGMRRFTRLTNGFSKKVENLAHAVSLHYMHYNFARPHKTLTKARNGYPTTPAMAAGVADHVWTLTEIAGLLD